MNYVKRKQQLDHILKDKSYWTSDNGFKDFLSDMHSKLSKGHSLSEKQEYAINNAVSRYAKYFFSKNDPDNKKKTDELKNYYMSVISKEVMKLMLKIS